jgi:hypothetical protein
MSTPVLIAVVTAIGALLSSIIAAIAAVVAATHGQRNAEAIHNIHVDLNSRLSELIAASKDVGRIEERAKQETANGQKGTETAS